MKSVLVATALLGLIASPVLAEPSSGKPYSPGASRNAPGQKQDYPGEAKKYAPGQRQKNPGDAKMFAPGQKQKSLDTTGQGSRRN